LFKKNILLRLFQQLLQFAIGIIIARQLEPTGNGDFTLFITEASFAILLVGLSLESSITYFLAKQKLFLGQMINICLSIFVFQVILFFCIYFFFSFFLDYTPFYFQKNGIGLTWAFIFIFSYIIMNSCNAILAASNLFGRIMVGNIILQLSFFLFLFINIRTNSFTSIVTTDKIIPIYSFFIFLQSILSIITLLVTKGKDCTPQKLSNINKNEIIRYTFFVFSANVIQFLSYRMDIWFVDYYLNKNELGLYSLSTKVSQLWWVLPQVLSYLFFPLISSGKVAKEKFNKIIFQMLFFAIITAVVAIFIYPFFVKYLVGELYKESYDSFICLLPGVVFFSITILITTKLSANGLVNINFRVSLICFIFIFLLDIFLIPLYGINGAAIASSIAYMVSTIYVIYKYKNETTV
jgi:O-antigen/teichoic acid export membrane protein